MSKRHTKELDAKLSDSSSEEEEQKMKKISLKEKSKKEVKQTSDDSSEDEVELLKTKTKRTEKVKGKKVQNSSEESSEEEEPKKVIKKKPQPKKEKSDSDSDSDSSEDEKPKKVAKKTPIKKDESSDSSSSEEEEEKPKKVAKKTPAKKEESSDSSDDEKPKKVITEKDEEKEDEKEANEGDLPANAYEELFVRNLSFNTTQEGLAEFFGKYGDVEEVKILTDRTTGKSRGIGFCKFYEKASAVKAMKDSENLELDGRNIQIRYSNDDSHKTGGNGNQGNRGGNRSNFQGTKYSIFVGNLSFKTNENSIKKYFSDCGNVIEVRLAKNEDGRLKGFAHVDFDSKEGVENAIKKNGQEFEGRNLKVDESTPRQGGSGGRGFGGRGGRGGRGFGGRGAPADPLQKAKKSGAIIQSTESKVIKIDSDSDDE